MVNSTIASRSSQISEMPGTRHDGMLAQSRETSRRTAAPEERACESLRCRMQAGSAGSGMCWRRALERLPPQPQLQDHPALPWMPRAALAPPQAGCGEPAELAPGGCCAVPCHLAARAAGQRQGTQRGAVPRHACWPRAALGLGPAGAPALPPKASSPPGCQGPAWPGAGVTALWGPQAGLKTCKAPG